MVGSSGSSFEKSDGQANWQIRVTGANTGQGNGFATLVWTAPAGAGKQDAAGSDQWWATRDLGDIEQGTNATLDDLVKAANTEGHTTVVDHYGISSQPNEKTGKVNVDNVSFNGCTTNFAASGAGGAFGSLENIFSLIREFDTAAGGPATGDRSRARFFPPEVSGCHPLTRGTPTSPLVGSRRRLATLSRPEDGIGGSGEALQS